MQNLWKSLLVSALTALSAAAAAAPTAYSINSDNGTGDADSLYRIDLATGTATRIGAVTSLGVIRRDVEGLAFAPDGTLYGVDDDTLKLFPINPNTAVVQTASEVPISGLPSGGSNDFGMTFGCDGTLYVTSVTKQTIYKMTLGGTATPIGSEGNLGLNISALAAYGDPVQLYGLGNGTKNAGSTEDVPYLYSINPNTGAPTPVGAVKLTSTAQVYTEGGLAFDDSGQLWLITDRSLFGEPSEVMQVDTGTGVASNVHETTGVPGFESLAITVPRGCQNSSYEDVATFKVQKQFLDGNNVTPVTLHISCNGGQPLDNSKTVQPNAGPFGEFEVSFLVEHVPQGGVDCDIFEDTPASYAASYGCFSDGTCGTAADRCTFTNAQAGQDNLCVIRNSPQPVEVSVIKEWVYGREGLNVKHNATIDLICENVFDGDGEWENGQMRWRWKLTENVTTETANVQPVFDGRTQCRTSEKVYSSAIETASTCENWTTIPLGAGALACTVTNTLFYEGVPALGPVGLALTVVLVLFTGLVASRRL